MGGYSHESHYESSRGYEDEQNDEEDEFERKMRSHGLGLDNEVKNISNQEEILLKKAKDLENEMR